MFSAFQKFFLLFLRTYFHFVYARIWVNTYEYVCAWACEFFTLCFAPKNLQKSQFLFLLLLLFYTPHILAHIDMFAFFRRFCFVHLDMFPSVTARKHCFIGVMFLSKFLQWKVRVSIEIFASFIELAIKFR